MPTALTHPHRLGCGEEAALAVLHTPQSILYGTQCACFIVHMNRPTYHHDCTSSLNVYVLSRVSTVCTWLHGCEVHVFTFFASLIAACKRLRDLKDHVFTWGGWSVSPSCKPVCLFLFPQFTLLAPDFHLLGCCVFRQSKCDPIVDKSGCPHNPEVFAAKVRKPRNCAQLFDPQKQLLVRLENLCV